jgi:hypothetical protein
LARVIGISKLQQVGLINLFKIDIVT